MGGYTILKAVWISFVVSSVAGLLNAAIHFEMLLSCPPASKSLMAGEKLELQWNYVVNETARKQWRISLYVFNNTGSAKLKISTLLQYKLKKNKWLPLKYQKINFQLSYDEAYLSIPATTFGDTAGYGILFEQLKGSNTIVRSFEKATDVTIVDMFLLPKKSSTVLRTWIGQPVKFVCAIELRDGADGPYSFTWKNVRKNVTITENISTIREKSELMLTPLNEDDFGSYKCYAKTVYTKIKHNMTLLKIEYPGYPILVNFLPEDTSLTWMAKTIDIEGKKLSFIVQFLQRNIKKWMNVNTTSELSMSLYSLSKYIPHYAGPYCIVRVCIEGGNEINITCSKNLEVKSDISPAPTVRLVSDSSKKITLSWKRKNADNALVLGYVIQMFPPLKYGEPKYSSVHLKYERRNENYTFGDLAVVQKFLFRVCIRNTLCIFEQSCSKKVGLHPVFPSKPRKVHFQFYNNSVSEGKISWEAPLETGKGILFYIVQVQREGKGKWRKENETKYLYATLTSLSLSDRIRVCARNDVDTKKISCSDKRGLSKENNTKELPAGSNGNSRNGARKFIIFSAIILTMNGMVSVH